MPKGDNNLVHLHAARRVRALQIPSGILGPDIVRLIEDGMILRTLADDPTATSYRKDRLQRLVRREGI